MPPPMNPPPPDDPLASRRRLRLGVLIIVLATLIAYLPAVRGGWIWDDDDYVTENELLHDADGLVELWKPGQTHQYYPVVFTAFWIEYQLWELNPLGYHLVNVLLHIANALLLWRIMRRLGAPGAWMIAAVFALHPMNVESVAWITERKNVLSGLFYLTAALAYLRFDPLRDEDEPEAAPPRSWNHYGLAIVLFIAALLSKSVTCSLPAALILVLLLCRQRLTLQRLWPLAPLFVIGLFAAMHTAHLEKESVGAVGADFDFSFLQRVLIASKALLFYPFKLLIPYPLIFIYPKWTIDEGAWLSYWSVVVVLLAGVGLLIAYVRGRRGPALAIAFYAGTIFPALGFFNVYPMRYSFVADHFCYLAGIGVIALVVSVLTRLIGSLRIAPLLAAVVLAVFAVLTWLQGPKYASAEALWRRTTADNPAAWMAQNNLGAILLRDHKLLGDAIDLLGRGDADAAAAILDQSERPELRQAASRLRALRRDRIDAAIPALQAMRQPLIEEAMERFSASLEVYPDHYQARGNLALALHRLERFDESLAQWRILLANERASAEDKYKMGLTLQQTGQTEEAIAHFRAILDEHPEHLATRLRLGEILAELERHDEAQAQFEFIVQRDPANLRLQRYLGGRAEIAGDYAKAIGHYETALQHARDRDESESLGLLVRLATIYALCPDRQYRDPARALQLVEPLMRLTGGRDPIVLHIFAAALAGAGRFEEAVRAAEQALELARASELTQLIAELEPRLAAYREGRTDPD
jgi:tetratricopeptide (TPR) repeat protein